jgi:multimeric flavodoxin WrbA
MADEVLRGARDAGGETAKIYLDDHLIRPIGEVVDNSRERDDPRKDDDFPVVLKQYLDSHIIVFSTPVYWQGASAQMKCFLDRLSSYFNHPSYRERFTGKGYIILCAFGRKESEHGRWITEPMKLTVKVLRGHYLGDVCASVYEKGRVKQMPDVLKACYDQGRMAEVALASAQSG